MTKLDCTSRDDYARAILQALLQAGGTLHISTIHSKVWDSVPIKKDDTGAQAGTGHVRRGTAIAYTLTKLKLQGYVEHVQRGSWRITDAGRTWMEGQHE